jgi:hypothetical protein
MELDLPTPVSHPFHICEAYHSLKYVCKYEELAKFSELVKASEEECDKLTFVNGEFIKHEIWQSQIFE